MVSKKILWIFDKKMSLKHFMSELETKVNAIIFSVDINDHSEIANVAFHYDIDIVIIEFNDDISLMKETLDIVIFEKHMSIIPIFIFSNFISVNFNIFGDIKDHLINVNSHNITQTINSYFLNYQ